MARRSKEELPPLMRGRICVVTGGSSGIGMATAIGLARYKAHVVVVSRSKERGERARREIRAHTGSESSEAFVGDLSTVAGTRALAAALLRRFHTLHVLVNNAGVIVDSREETEDGYERTFATNHLGPFLLTHLLLPHIVKGATGRILNITCAEHRGQTLDLDDLQGTRDYRWKVAYGRSKLANILFARELSERVAPLGVTVNAVNPGAVSTNLGGGSGGLKTLAFRMVRSFRSTPEEGAALPVWAASAPDLAGITGQYYETSGAVDPSPEALDPTAARRLWEASVRLTGLRPHELMA